MSESTPEEILAAIKECMDDGYLPCVVIYAKKAGDRVDSSSLRYHWGVEEEGVAGLCMCLISYLSERMIKEEEERARRN